MEKNKQIIKGDNNNQTNVAVQNNYGVSAADVITLIKEYCQPNINEIEKMVTKCINSIDSCNFVMPDKRTFIPFIQQLSYSMDDEQIRSTYENLLKSSMNKNKKEDIHPSFVTVINQLVSDEVKILNNLVVFQLYPLINIKVKVKGDSKNSGVIVVSNFTNMWHGVCQNPKNISSFIDNLVRLNLIEILPTIYLDESYYNLMFSDLIKKSNVQLNDEQELTYDKKCFRLTSYGEQFLKCCKD